MLTKNVVSPSGWTELFLRLRVASLFLKQNQEYSAINIWTFLDSTRANTRGLDSLCEPNVNIIYRDKAVEYLKSVLHGDTTISRLLNPQIKQVADENFIKVNASSSLDGAYFSFMSLFFPNMDSWQDPAILSSFPMKSLFTLPAAREIKPKPYIVLHTMSSKSRNKHDSRFWASPRWGRLIGLIKQYFRYDIYVIGVEEDKGEHMQVAFGEAGHKNFKKTFITDMRGKTSMVEALDLVYNASAVIGTNSWATVMSAWAGIPTYILWFSELDKITQELPLGYNAPFSHITIQQPVGSDINKLQLFHPTVETVWQGVREVVTSAERAISKT